MKLNIPIITHECFKNELSQINIILLNIYLKLFFVDCMKPKIEFNEMNKNSI